MTSSNVLAQNKKYILLNNLGRKHSLLTKLGQFMSYYKRKKLSQNSTKIATWKLVSGPFLFEKI